MRSTRSGILNLPHLITIAVRLQYTQSCTITMSEKPILPTIAFNNVLIIIIYTSRANRSALATIVVYIGPGYMLLSYGTLIHIV